MYKLYQNKYSNYLNLSLINVRYARNNVIEDNNFAILLRGKFEEETNDIITFKIFVFLGCLLTQNGLNDEILTLETKTLEIALKTSKKAHIIYSLNYLKAITFNYLFMVKKKKYEKRSCKIIDDYKTSRGSITIKFSKEFLKLIGYSRNQFVGLPNELFKLDIKNYKHSTFLGYYILLHRKRNYNNKNRNRNTISVKELIKNCPLLPKYEKLKQGQVSRSIIKPFENNLNYLAKTFNFTWKYENEISSYISFLNNKIYFDFSN